MTKNIDNFQEVEKSFTLFFVKEALAKDEEICFTFESTERGTQNLVLTNKRIIIARFILDENYSYMKSIPYKNIKVYSTEAPSIDNTINTHLHIEVGSRLGYHFNILYFSMSYLNEFLSEYIL